MIRDDLIRIAREAGFTQSNPHADLIVIHSNGSWVGIEERLQRFAELVAAAEREACAKVCESESEVYAAYAQSEKSKLTADCAALIRARGEQP